MKYRPLDILLAEDNDDDVVLIQECMAETKLVNVVGVVRDGSEALSFLRREGKFQNAPRPALLLLDINMPNKNGFEVLQEIKADPNLHHLPVIMLTTSDRDEDIVRAYAAGACSYIAKPSDFCRLREIVKGLSHYWATVVRTPDLGEMR